TCIICLEPYKNPVCIPCGHVFCHRCLIRVIQFSKPYTTHQQCPVCRNSYTIAAIDPSLIPSHLRPYIQSSIRRVYIDMPEAPPLAAGADSGTAPLPKPTPEEYAQTQAENRWLRENCVAWRRRAEIQQAALLGLAGLARSARDYAHHLKEEKDTLERQFHSLKRKMVDEE
ncbi:hypothetical protein PLICRDRAFT_70406, partial [Plicaturopsis crispa FD-325 SS-3]